MAHPSSRQAKSELDKGGKIGNGGPSEALHGRVGNVGVWGLLRIEEGLGQGVDAGAAVAADGGAPDVAGERRARHAASVQMEFRLFREVQDGEAPVAGAQVAVRDDRRFPHEPARGHLGAGEPVAPAGPRLSLADALEGGLPHRQVALEVVRAPGEEPLLGERGSVVIVGGDHVGTVRAGDVNDRHVSRPGRGDAQVVVADHRRVVRAGLTGHTDPVLAAPRKVAPYDLKPHSRIPN